MNFAALPPEVNSGLMYAGPGSGPMLAAATAWEAIAAELRSTATVCESVVSALTSGPWLGLSSGAMTAAVAPYLGWLATTGVQAEQTAIQARVAAAAYDTAFAMTVPPPVVAANRVQLAALVATNIFGQNAPTIAATEAHYGEMWAQDAVAMYGYQSAAMAATKLPPFAPPVQIANPAGAAVPAAAAVEATGQAALSQLLPAAATLPAQAIEPAALIPALALAVSTTSVSVSPSIAGAAWNAAAQNSRLLIANSDAIFENTQGILLEEAQLREILSDLRGMTLPTASAGLVGPMPVSAAVGQAVSAGKLSVPLSWAAAGPEIRTVAYAAPTAGVGLAAAVAEGAPGTAFSQMALAGMGGSALAGSVGRGQRERAAATPAQRMPPIRRDHEPPPERLPDSPIDGIVAGLRQLGELRDSGVLTTEEFRAQKQRLLCSPLR